VSPGEQRNLVTFGLHRNSALGQGACYQLAAISDSLGTSEPRIHSNRNWPLSAVFAIAALLASCSANGPASNSALDPTPAPTQDAATRAQPVVVGRPSRVFIMAGFGAKCEPVSAPTLTITESPKQGDISFVVGQDTTIAASVQGTCVGQKAKGTGIYYTARAGAQGSDTFAVKAVLASGETSTRAFQVTITE
jgi:hypothetical protein